jgi:hypothetical protein
MAFCTGTGRRCGGSSSATDRSKGGWLKDCELLVSTINPFFSELHLRWRGRTMRRSEWTTLGLLASLAPVGASITNGGLGTISNDRAIVIQ